MVVLLELAEHLVQVVQLRAVRHKTIEVWDLYFRQILVEELIGIQLLRFIGENALIGVPQVAGIFAANPRRVLDGLLRENEALPEKQRLPEAVRVSALELRSEAVGGAKDLDRRSAHSWEVHA